MISRKIKTFSLILAVLMVVTLIVPKADFTERPSVSETETELKEFTVSDKDLKEIVVAAKKDGSKAAARVNELNGNDFEVAVNKILTEYYKDGDTDCCKAFEENVNAKAAGIIKGYKEAAKERKNADKLSYEAGTSILTFGADISKQKIKDIVADQYGECEYIYKCTDGTYIVKVKNSLGLTVDKAVDAYGAYDETMQVARNDKVEQISEAYELVNDTYAANQYYLRTMKVVDAWQYIRGVNHSKVKVAVIDGGADLNSADLQASSSLSAEILSDGSYIPLRQSTSMYNNNHGTAVAGVLAGTANNGTQIAGVASCINNDVAELINVKIEMYVDKIAVGLDYARQVGAKVANLSLAHEGANDVEEAAINNFVAAGGTVVAGAGNNGSDVATYPSDYANTISVISVDESYNIAATSNRGWNKDICAPGVAIYAPNITGSGSDTIVAGGTSFASPMVSAIVTMMYSVNAGLNSNTVKNILINTAKDLGDSGRDYTYAYGFANAYAAVVSAAGGTVEETTTTVSSDTPSGYTTAGANWTNLNCWSVYFASDWGGNPTGSYKDGGSYNDFGVYVNKYSGAEWGVQMKTQILSTTIGKTYTCKVSATFNSDMTDTITFKDEGTQTTKKYTLVNGTNNFEIDFTPTADNTQIFIDLGKVPAGGNFVITSFSLEEKEETTTKVFDAFGIIEAEQFTSNQGGVVDTNSSASGGHNIGGVSNGVYMTYENVNFNENASAIEFCYSSPTGTALGNAEIYVDDFDNKVGTIVLTNNASSWQEYGNVTANLDSKISAGSHIVYVKYVTTGDCYYVANVDYFKFIKESDIVTEEPTTEEPTTEKMTAQEETTKTINTINGGIEINGYQISATTKGMRVVYSVDSEINGKEVVSSGLIYSLADYVDASELYVGSSSYYVRSYESTSAGKSDRVFSDSDIATSYAMTMKFAAGTAPEYSDIWRIRAYAKLSDGTYVYTDSYTYTIYDVADILYQGCKMNSKEHHEYLYNDILSVVNKEYKTKDYDWSSTVVKG